MDICEIEQFDRLNIYGNNLFEIILSGKYIKKECYF